MERETDVTDVRQHQQEPLVWPHSEDKVILGFLSNNVKTQVMQRPYMGAPSGCRLGELVNEQLGLYYSLLKHGDASLAGVFSDIELALMSHVFDGISINPPDLLSQYMVDNLSDFLSSYSGVVTQLGVDGSSLLAKVKALDVLARYALVDMLDQRMTHTFNQQ